MQDSAVVQTVKITPTPLDEAMTGELHAPLQTEVAAAKTTKVQPQPRSELQLPCRPRQHQADPV